MLATIAQPFGGESEAMHVPQESDITERLSQQPDSNRVWF